MHQHCCPCSSSLRVMTLSWIVEGPKRPLGLLYYLWTLYICFAIDFWPTSEIPAIRDTLPYKGWVAQVYRHDDCHQSALSRNIYVKFQLSVLPSLGYFLVRSMCSCHRLWFLPRQSLQFKLIFVPQISKENIWLWYSNRFVCCWPWPMTIL